jgi:hypothetical protein
MVLVLGDPLRSDSVSTRRGERVLTPREAGVLAEALALSLTADDLIANQTGEPVVFDTGDRAVMHELAVDLRDAAGLRDAA